MSDFFTKEQHRHAARFLGLPEDYIIVMQASQICILDDPNAIADQFADEICVSPRDLGDAIYESLRYADVPAGWRYVGMRQKDTGPDGDRTYGFVDFSALGAK